MSLSDEDLEHMCRLSVITVDMIRNPNNGITISEISDREARNMLTILADTFVHLMNRQGIKPKFSKSSQGATNEQ
jgi:hypothetical protein